MVELPMRRHSIWSFLPNAFVLELALTFGVAEGNDSTGGVEVIAQGSGVVTFIQLSATRWGLVQLHNPWVEPELTVLHFTS